MTEEVKIATCQTEDGSTSSKNPYNFPFKPYDIQLELMQKAYESFEKRKFSILESPTGTGKSLSLICSSLTWLKNCQANTKLDLENKKEELVNKIEKFKLEEEKADGDWLCVQTKRQDVNRELDKINRELEIFTSFQSKNEARWHAKLHGKSYDDYAALTNGVGSKTSHNCDTTQGEIKSENSSSQQNLLFSSQESSNQNGTTATAEEGENLEEKLKFQQQQQQEQHLKPKIYYASRTHSQLSQFIGEIKKTSFADSLNGPAIKIAPLGSRANLCVNMEVTRLKDSSAINERCVELQRETKQDKRCPYLKSKLISQLKEEILSSVQDIEDIVSKGRAIGACPYYATRMAIPETEVVVLPYNNLLHQETRIASSLNLKDSVVIIDEAHNILETICSIHSAQVSGQQLISSHSLLSKYYQKYHSRMTPKNAETIRTIVLCLTTLIKFLNKPQEHIREYEQPKSRLSIDEYLKTPDNKAANKNQQVVSNGNKFKILDEEIMIDVNKFTCSSNMERFNIFKIIDYFNRSQLARKLIGMFKQDSSYDLTIDLFEQKKDSNSNGKSNQVRSGKKTPPSKRRKVLTKQASNDLAKITGEDSSFSISIKSQETTNLSFLIESIPNLSGKSKVDSSVAAYPIYMVIEFLKSLTNLANDGRICIHHVQGDIEQSSLKFILLNPSSQFKQMTQDARSIILAGGTMKPFQEFVDLLFGPLGIDEKRLTLFSCNHVIEKDHLFVATINNGSTGKPLELSFKTRNSYDYIDEIGRTISNLSVIIPGGMVCFFPSYEYEQFCNRRWAQIGVISSIESKSKQVFREPRQTSHTKPILDEYSKTIERGANKGRGALLMCVVGGKMSEGINFNDDLGRCVVMVGLPYANIKSGELQQKMAYYDQVSVKKRQSAKTIDTPISSTVMSNSATSFSQQYYENLCIRGINQSIGRAVRHKQDYAAIILLDRRYSVKTSIRNGLPDWIKRSLVDHERFGPLLAQLKGFFNKRMEASNN